MLCRFLSELRNTSSVIFKQLSDLIENKLSTRMLIIFIDRTISDEKVEELKNHI